MNAEHTHLNSTLPRHWLNTRKPGSLVIFRALQLGDMLCAVPAFRALRAALPTTRIALVGLPWAAQFAARFPNYIDEFIEFPAHQALSGPQARPDVESAFYTAMRSHRFDLALQMHGSGGISNLIVQSFGARCVAGFGLPGRTPSGDDCFLPYPDSGPEPLRLLDFTEFLGAPPIGTHLEFPITDADERELAGSRLADGLPLRNYLCVHPGARSRDKCWPPQLFAQVADKLADEFGLPVVLTGCANEASLTAAVAARMRTQPVDAAPLSIGAMAALMNRARLLLCNDTGVSHIAAGLKLPSVVVFSKADIRRWAPLDQQRHRCLWDPDGARAVAVLGEARALLGNMWDAGWTRARDVSQARA